jgi:hypothetical protein
MDPLCNAVEKSESVVGNQYRHFFFFLGDKNLILKLDT